MPVDLRTAQADLFLSDEEFSRRCSGWGLRLPGPRAAHVFPRATRYRPGLVPTIGSICGRGAGANCKLGSETSLPDRKSTRLNSSHQLISYAVFCLKKKKK